MTADKIKDWQIFGDDRSGRAHGQHPERRPGIGSTQTIG